MDGIHDLGGKRGYGPVQTNDCLPDNRAGFHDRWEARVFAILRALPDAGALQNTDQFRHAVERIDPVAYLTHSYYGRWLGALETLLVEAGVLLISDIDERAGNQASAARPLSNPVSVPPPQGSGSYRGIDTEPRYRVGEPVLAQSLPTAGHTRLPAYVRGKRGTIRTCYGGWVLPDSNAMGGGECPTHLYSVAFDGVTLWGEAAEPGTFVCVDLFEPYLDRAT